MYRVCNWEWNVWFVSLISEQQLSLWFFRPEFNFLAGVSRCMCCSGGSGINSFTINFRFAVKSKKSKKGEIERSRKQVRGKQYNCALKRKVELRETWSVGESKWFIASTNIWSECWQKSRNECAQTVWNNRLGEEKVGTQVCLQVQFYSLAAATASPVCKQACKVNKSRFNRTNLDKVRLN